MNEYNKSVQAIRQARTETPGVKGNKRFAESQRHEATVDADLSDMVANREVDLIAFRDATEQELALDAHFIADTEKIVSLIDARSIVAEYGIQRVTYDIYEWENNHLTNNPTSIIDKDGNTVLLAEHPLDGKLAAALDNASSQRGLEVLSAKNEGRSIHLDMADAPHVSVLTRERHVAARELAEARRRADFLECEVVKADRAVLAKRLNDSGLPGAKVTVDDVGWNYKRPRFEVTFASTIDEDWPEGSNPETMGEDEYNDIVERITVAANNTYSQTTLRAICKGRGGEFANSVARSDFDEWEPAA